MSTQGFNGVAAWTKPRNFETGGQAICLDWQHEWNETDLAGKIICFPAETGSTHAPLPISIWSGTKTDRPLSS